VIAADTSSLIAFFAGEEGNDIELVRGALSGNHLCLPPVVIVELLSDAKTHDTLEEAIADWPILEPTQGYWLRASANRSQLIAKKLAAKVPDALIAQSCIDYDVALITRDGDFRHFAKHCGLKLA
jgi:predicted nucleic acid-binding protein